MINNSTSIPPETITVKPPATGQDTVQALRTVPDDVRGCGSMLKVCCCYIKATRLLKGYKDQYLF